VTILSPREAYRLWAPSYAAETAISALDEELCAALAPSGADKRLLDAGCGIGRRYRNAEATLAVGIDASPEMLAEGAAPESAAADVRALPFAAGVFDLVWCRLVLGHLPDSAPAYGELGRVLRAGGYLFVSDFHPDAAGRGSRRTFRDGTGALHEVEHHIHPLSRHIQAAEAAGFRLAAQRDGHIGPSIRHFFEAAGRLPVYQADLGLPVVAAFLFQRL